MTRALPVLSLLSCLLAPLAAHAQQASAADRLSLAEAMSLAEQNNPALAVARQEAALAAADVVTARQRPNPVFEAASEGYRPGGPGGFVDGQELSLQMSQELETGGRRAARVRVAAAGQAAADAMLADVLRQVRRQVGRAYFALAGARAEAEAAATALDEIDRVIEVNRARYEQGEISGGELRRLEVERLRFADDALAAELTARQATSELRAMLGMPNLDRPVEPVEGLSTAAAGVPPASDLLALAIENRSDIAALRHEQARARADRQLQQALRRPAPTVTGGYRRELGDNGVILGVSIPLPLFDRNAGGVARADAASRLADARLRQAETAVAVDVQQAIDALDVSRRRLDSIERDYLSRSREARDAVAAAYRAGEADLIDFLDAQRAFRDVQRAHTRALVELRLSLFGLQAAIGAIPGEPRS